MHQVEGPRLRSPFLARLCLTAAALVSANCGLTGPSKSVAGNWTARGIGHSSSYELTLTQSGDTISGVACHGDSGFLVFRDAPVGGDYPTIHFAAQSSGSFVGKFEEDRDEIAGDLGHIPLRFFRSESGTCAGIKE